MVKDKLVTFCDCETPFVTLRELQKVLEDEVLGTIFGIKTGIIT
jgi:hypothetical protein